MNDISKAATLRSFYETARALPEGKDREEFMFAIMQYQFDGVEPEFKSQLARIGFVSVKANIDADLNRKIEGSNGGRHSAKLSGEDKDEILQLYNAGKTCDEIAQKYGISRRYVYKIVNKPLYANSSQFCELSVNCEQDVNKNSSQFCELSNENVNENERAEAHFSSPFPKPDIVIFTEYCKSKGMNNPYALFDKLFPDGKLTQDWQSKTDVILKNLEGVKNFAPKNALSPPQENYAKKILDIWNNASLPCCKGNFITFMQKDFKDALPFTKGMHSADVIQAARNFTAIIKKQNTDPFWKRQVVRFDEFCGGKLLKQFLPDNFRAERYRVEDTGGVI